MTMSQILLTMKPVFGSPLFSTLLTAAFSTLLGSYAGLRTYQRQSKELVDGAIAWRWTGKDEEPFLVIQNRSAVPAYIIRARFLRGLFFRREARKYAFNYVEMTDGNMPIEITEKSVSQFPLSTHMADQIVGQASPASRWIGYALKRSYLWIEISTLSGRTLLIPANDVTTFANRPLWLDARWIPEPRLKGTW